MPLERLHKVLAHAGFGSRRKCEELIAEGTVQVDGKTVTEMGLKVDPDRQKIKCRDQYVRMPARVILIMNKPKGVVSTTSDTQGRRTVVDLLRGVRERVYPAGRLDADSQGMMILTNDGDLTEKLTHPRHGVPKTYHVVVRGEVPDAVLAKAKRGVWLAEGRTGPVRVRILKRNREATVLEVTLREGMNREVRRIFARFGFKVDRLKRIRIGALGLGPLPEGQFRRLTDEEVVRLLEAEPDSPVRRAARPRSGKEDAGSKEKGEEEE
jgi:23S rRNA pseudouridine2605 synthase